MSKKGTGKLILGGAIGAGLALLFAPKKGEELREDLKNKLSDLLNKAKEVDVEDVKENIENKIAEIKSEIEDLDKEKVKKIAEKKAKELKKKTEELVEYAKEKGTPVLEKASKEVSDAIVGTFFCNRTHDTYVFKSDKTGFFTIQGGSPSEFTWKRSGRNVTIKYEVFGEQKLKFDEKAGTITEKSESFGTLVFEKQ